MTAETQPPSRAALAAHLLRASQQTVRGPNLSRLGALNGLLFGLALAAGMWVPAALALGRSPVRLSYPEWLLGTLGLALITTLAGWLTSRWERGAGALLAWAVATLLVVAWLGHLPYDGRNLLIGLLDPRFWGRAAYPFDPAVNLRMWVAGFFIALALILFGLVQNYRLEGVRGSFARGRLSARSVVLLLLPLPLVALAGWVADDNLNRPLRTPPLLVAEALDTSRSYPGDLLALSRETGINYGAITPVRSLIGDAGYSLMLVNLDSGGTGLVSADFDNGAWVYCRVLAGQLSFCFDASPPYVRGLAGALSGAGTPDCQPCALTVSPTLAAWLREQAAHFSGPPQITRLAQWGSQVLMRAADPASGYAIECFFTGTQPYTLSECQEV